MKKSLKSNLGSKVLENNTSCHDLKKELKTETLKCICLERVTKLFVRLLGFRTPVNHSERHYPQMEKTSNRVNCDKSEKRKKEIIYKYILYIE